MQFVFTVISLDCQNLDLKTHVYQAAATKCYYDKSVSGKKTKHLEKQFSIRRIFKAICLPRWLQVSQTSQHGPTDPLTIAYINEYNSSFSSFILRKLHDSWEFVTQVLAGGYLGYKIKSICLWKHWHAFNTNVSIETCLNYSIEYISITTQFHCLHIMASIGTLEFSRH